MQPKSLSNEEYNVLSKITSKTKMDCWCDLRQDSKGRDYVYDLENGGKLSIKTAVEYIIDGLDCQENFDACELTSEEKEIFRNLIKRLGLHFNL